ncbi:ribosomal RNA small subunit methyltransferase nep-1 [Iris pallida]|uniref:Ribosomal RNA small subunit methyltransferase nep-1 n=1 Tax=Iris pallida TaxID=29817 RepID=A0AAX6HY95_IRIPA|nr:ribosomal RNA small subunit methyltransferase nep-1 [Iris pallida]
MTRPYAVKAKKTKKRPRVEEEEEEKQEVQIEEEEEETGGGDNDGGVDSPAAAEAAAADQLDGIPISRPVVASKKPGVIFLLDRASLEVAKVGKNFQILNSDDHANFLKKQNRNPADYRPDIIHQALLAILDSPLTKAGRLQALYVRTEKGVLFEVKPHVRMPRTFKRFCGLMLQLLQKLSITAAGKREKLLNVIKNDIGRYLPVNSRRIGLSRSSEKMVQMRDYVAAASDDVNLVFVVGAMAHGKINNDNTDDFISISNYPLSAACCLGRICNALEHKWKII